jgi:hypothetical protein
VNPLNPQTEVPVLRSLLDFTLYIDADIQDSKTTTTKGLEIFVSLYTMP